MALKDTFGEGGGGVIKREQENQGGGAIWQLEMLAKLVFQSRKHEFCHFIALAPKARTN